jgi:ElaB/YqjD/DUF883 family membrane-anchored ribosome-binding protein
MAETTAPEPADPDPNGPTEETLQQFAEAQLKDAEVREKELALKEKQLKQNKQQAQQSLEAQLQDRERARDHQNRIHKRNTWSGTGIIGVAFLFLGFLVWYGHPQIAFEIIKVCVYGGVGYFAGKQAGKAASQGDASTE